MSASPALAPSSVVAAKTASTERRRAACRCFPTCGKRRRNPSLKSISFRRKGNVLASFKRGKQLRFPRELRTFQGVFRHRLVASRIRVEKHSENRSVCRRVFRKLGCKLEGHSRSGRDRADDSVG